MQASARALLLLTMVTTTGADTLCFIRPPAVLMRPSGCVRPTPARAVCGAGGDARARAFDAARRGEPALAEDLLREHLLQPQTCSDFAAYNCLGAMCAQQGKFDEAIASFRSALAASAAPTDDPAVREARANAFFNLGNAHTALSQHADALAAFEQSMLIRADDAEAVTNMGNAFLALGDQANALKAFERAVALDTSNPIALLNCGNALCDTGRTSEGVMMMMEALEAGAAADASVCLNIGVAARRAGMNDIAAEFLDRTLACDANNVLAKRLLLAINPPSTSTTDGSSAADDVEYAKMLFDEDAQGYETQMVTNLQYQAPARLLDLLLANVSAASEQKARKGALWSRVMDAGCGSGLAGDLLRPHSTTLVGVDVAPAMVTAARRRCKDDGVSLVYDEVKEADVIQALQGEAPGALDVVVAADVLCYLSDLHPFMVAVCHALAPEHGLLAFSCEALAGDEESGEDSAGVALLDTGRYAHSEQYLRQVAMAAGIDLMGVEKGRLRMNGAEWVEGFFCLCRKTCPHS